MLIPIFFVGVESGLHDVISGGCGFLARRRYTRGALI